MTMSAHTPSAEHHQIADHEVAGRDRGLRTVADRRRPPRYQVTKVLGSTLRPMFLDEGEHGIGDDDRGDGGCKLGQARDEGQARSEPQHEGEEVGELPTELLYEAGTTD